MASQTVRAREEVRLQQLQQLLRAMEKVFYDPHRPQLLVEAVCVGDAGGEDLCFNNFIRASE